MKGHGGVVVGKSVPDHHNHPVWQGEPGKGHTDIHC